MSVDVYSKCLNDVLAPLASGDSRPASVQIAERICQAIEDGRLRQGRRLPTMIQIGSRYHMTPTVALLALRRVAAGGYATIAPDKQGYYVRGLPPHQRTAHPQAGT